MKREFNSCLKRTVTVLVVGLVALAAQVAAAREPVRALFLGDSLADFDRGENLVDQLQEKLDAVAPRYVNLYNYSIGGDTITRILERIDGKKGAYALQRYAGIFGPKYDWAFVFLGHNDTKASSAKNFTVPYVALKDAEAGYLRLINLLKAKGVKRIILISPSSSNFEVCRANTNKRLAAMKAGKVKKDGVNRFGEPKHMEAFANVVKQVAQNNGCEYCDIYTPMKALPDKATYLRPGDGVHLTPKGHAWVAERLFEYLQQRTW